MNASLKFKRSTAVLDAPSNLGLRLPEVGAVPGCYKLPWALRDRGMVQAILAADLGSVVPPHYDDYLKRSVAIGRFSLPIVENQKGSYAELMTIVLVGELRSQDHVGDWFDLVKVEYAALFPSLPHRTRYYRVLKQLERTFADFALRFAGADTLHVIDSF